MLWISPNFISLNYVQLIRLKASKTKFSIRNHQEMLTSQTPWLITHSLWVRKSIDVDPIFVGSSSIFLFPHF